MQTPQTPPWAGRDTTHYIRAPSNLVLNTDGVFTTCLGNIFQGLTSFCVNNCFLTSNLNLSSFMLKSFCLGLWLSPLVNLLADILLLEKKLVVTICVYTVNWMEPKSCLKFQFLSLFGSTVCFPKSSKGSSTFYLGNLIKVFIFKFFFIL